MHEITINNTTYRMWCSTSNLWKWAIGSTGLTPSKIEANSYFRRDYNFLMKYWSYTHEETGLRQIDIFIET